MKKVLIIDNHQLFRDFLKSKLSIDQLEVSIAQQNRDSYTKMITLLPNLIIMDMGDDPTEEIAFLEKKAKDINTSNIPVIITGPAADKNSIASLAKYGVIKYFAKPIQFDIFFDSIGNVLKVPLSMDLTPSVLDLHHNGNIVFIELAQGLNREKIALLQYKLSEMIVHENIDNPKIIIMFTNIKLTFVDGYNLEFLIENIQACPKVHNKNIIILTTSQFVRDLIDGHVTYSGIETASNLPKVLTSLMDTSITSSVSDLIVDRILLPTEIGSNSGTVDTRFYSDNTSTEEDFKNHGTVLHLAIIDSDTQTLLLSKTVFETVGADVKGYTNAQDFLEEYEGGKFDLVILDVTLNDNRGVEILTNFSRQFDAPPVVIYSPALPKDMIVKVISLGAKNCLIKPLKPNELLKKCLGVLHGEFEAI